MARYLRTMVAALAATGAITADASAEWSAPFEISDPAGVAERPQIAVDPYGTATVVWTNYGASEVAVHARRIDPYGARGPILDVSVGEEALNAQVAVDPAGNATVVWTGHEGSDAVARARRITAAGVLEPVKTLSALGEIGFSPTVGVDADGHATSVWTRYENPHFRVQARRIDASGALGPIQDLTPDSEGNVNSELAVDSAGHSYVVWPWNNGTETVIQWRRLDDGVIVGPIEDLSAAGANAFDPQVAVDDAGVPTAVWYRDDGTIQARRSATGAIVDLSETEAVDPEVAVGPSGDATVVWTRYDGVVNRVELRVLAADGSLGPVRDLWTGGDDLQPRVAGNAAALWLHTEPGETVVRSHSLGVTRDMTAAGEEVAEPEIATDAAGRAIAVWTRVDGSDRVLEGARLAVPAAPAPAAPAVPVAATSCPVVTVKRLKSFRPKGRRAKGIAATLTLSHPARLRLESAKLRTKGRMASLRSDRRTTGTETKLRLRLPGRVARRLAVGTRVTLILKLRARSTAGGCGYGPVKTVRLRTKLARI